MKNKLFKVLALLMTVSMLLAACGGTDSGEAPATGGTTYISSSRNLAG